MMERLMKMWTKMNKNLTEKLDKCQADLMGEIKQMRSSDIKSDDPEDLKTEENKKKVVKEEMDTAEEKIETAEEENETIGEKKDFEDEKMEAVKKVKDVVDEEKELVEEMEHRCVHIISDNTEELKPAENKKGVAEDKKGVVEEEMDAAEEKIEAAEEEKEAVGEKKKIEDEKMEAVKEDKVDEEKELPEQIELTQQNNSENIFKFQLENALIITPKDYQNNMIKVSQGFNSHLDIKRCVHTIRKHFRFKYIITKIPQKQFKKKLKKKKKGNRMQDPM
jgi:hypothetical protein